MKMSSKDNNDEVEEYMKEKINSSWMKYQLISASSVLCDKINPFLQDCGKKLRLGHIVCFIM